MLKKHLSPRLAKTACMFAVAFAPAFALADSYTQTNLVSDIPGLAVVTDPNLKNPWGVSFAATSPFWVSDQGAGVASLYTGVPVTQGLVVSVPGATTGPTGPTGQVFNTSTGFAINKGTAATFIFDNLNGTISAWNGAQGTTAVVQATTAGAIYTGLTQVTNGSTSFLYAADSTGSIHVFDSGWTDVTATSFAGKFSDSSLPAGYTPYNIQNINGNIYVTYAKMGAGGGYVDEYDANGNFLRRIATNGPLNAPWGIVLAPSGFGTFSNDLLIGNFGSGQIDAYDPTTDAFLGALDGANGQPIVNSGLWALETRTGGTGNNTSAVYFTAGINGEKDGLFGELALNSTPEPASIFGTATGLIALAMSKFKFRRRS